MKTNTGTNWRTRWVVAVVLVAAASSDIHAGSFTVTNTNNSGSGSLRQAILNANTSSGADTIKFDISGPGPHTILPTSELPVITDPVTIDGYTQAGASPNTNATGIPNNAVLMIELHGALAGYYSVGLTISAGDSTVRGLVISRFLSGIWIYGNGGNVIEGNFIGTDVRGTRDLGNSNYGVTVWNANFNRIGGTETGARNLISGNNWAGIASIGCDNSVCGNFIGTDVTGTYDLGNSNRGVEVFENANDNTIGPGNVISGNNWDGIGIAGGRRNSIRENYIGTDVTGTLDLGNSRRGVLVWSGASDNTVEFGNVISGNNRDGIQIDQSSGNTVSDNRIGTDVTGTLDLGNSYNGVLISGYGADDNTVEFDNVISGNGKNGISILGGHGDRVRDNFIGTDATGTVDLGNSANGVYVNTTETTIGDSVFPNVISGNSGNGIWLNGERNSVRGNFIGTDRNGAGELGNTQHGIWISGAHHTIGGDFYTNIIVGNGGDGIFLTQGEDNLVSFNIIGSDWTKTRDMGNAGNGITIADGMSFNMIRFNSILGNDWFGVSIYGTATDNLIDSNIIERSGNIDAVDLTTGIGTAGTAKMER